MYTEQLLELHRGQGIEIYWRDNFQCPTEEEYKEMTMKSKTCGFLINMTPNFYLNVVLHGMVRQIGQTASIVFVNWWSPIFIRNCSSKWHNFQYKITYFIFSSQGLILVHRCWYVTSTYLFLIIIF